MDLADAVWRKSSYTGNENRLCVEVAGLDDRTAVRDSKDPSGGTLVFGSSSWARFLSRLKAESDQA